MTDLPIGDPRPAGTEGPAGDQRPAGEDGLAGDPRPGGEESVTVDTPSTSSSTEYDPGAYTVEEVLAHLDTLAEDDPERERILQAERDGKARVTITG